jgi:molecular chaperone HtpG
LHRLGSPQRIYVTDILPNDMKTIRRAFISYSSVDAEVARAVADSCEKVGAVVFLDQRSLQPADEWYESLKRNLADADVVFVLVSAAALKSRYVNQEIGMARQAGAKVVPLFLLPQGALPTEIGSLHGASIAGLRGSALDDSVAALLAQSERSAIDLPPVLRDRLFAHEPRTASAFLALLPAALGAPVNGAPFLLPRLREHGPRHVERLLRLAAWTLGDASLPQLSTRDVVALVVAVVLRERVLYVPLPALQELLRRSALPPFALADDLPVQRLWQNFVQRIRYDEAGSSELDHRALLDLALDGAAAAEGGALLLLGRFVREHQGRLAHEAAAVPPQGFVMPRVLDDLLPGRIRAIVPLLARCGDEGLRGVVDVMAGRGPKPRLVEGAVPVLLAAALRCATHLDQYAAVSDSGLVQKPAELAADTASEPALRSIVELRYDRLTDAQVLQLDASPESAFAYQDVLAWTRGLQARLDECWAVIGEVYGDGRFSLKLRTATTSLADPARLRFDKSLPFVPQLARLRTASAKLIRLLTAPLYGDKPEVGVRELLQNAVDAVRERAHWPPAATEAANPQLEAWRCDVLIRLLPPADAEGNGWIEVVDGGVGMTPDTVRDYFLRVGASLRHDADWLQRFPAAQQVQLLRSGRFGIGTLAAYLLGNEVHVTTRHVTEADGIGTHFVARLSDAPIELRRAPAPLGTSIRVPVSAAVFGALAANPKGWDWFALQTPRVVRVVGDDLVTPAVAESEDDLAHCLWRRLPFDGLERVLWRPGTDAQQRLWCNGLLLENAHETIYGRRYSTDGPWIFNTADLMVFDARARLPMAVTRDRLIGVAPYHDALRRDFLLDHCAWLLARAALPQAGATPPAPMWEHYGMMSPGDGMLTAPPYVEVDAGLLPWATSNIASSGITTVVAFDGQPASTSDASHLGCAFAPLRMEIFGGFSPESRVSVATRHLRDFVQTIVPAVTIDVLTRFDDDAKAFAAVGSADGFVWRSNDTRVDPATAGQLVPLASMLAQRHGAMVVAFATVDPLAKPRSDALTRIWDELGLPAVIPRDAAARERACGPALAVLGDRVVRHLGYMGTLQERPSKG